MNNTINTNILGALSTISKAAKFYKDLGCKLDRYKYNENSSPEEEFTEAELSILKKDGIDVYNVEYPGDYICYKSQIYDVEIEGYIHNLSEFVNEYADDFSLYFTENIHNDTLREIVRQSVYDCTNSGFIISDIDVLIEGYDEPLSSEEKEILEEIVKISPTFVKEMDEVQDYNDFLESNKFYKLSQKWIKMGEYIEYCENKTDELYSIINASIESLHIEPAEYIKFNDDDDNIYAHYSIDEYCFDSTVEDDEQSISRTIDSFLSQECAKDIIYDLTKAKKIIAKELDIYSNVFDTFHYYPIDRNFYCDEDEYDYLRELLS